MTELVGLYLAGCGLLALAGALKVIRPHDTARAASVLRPGMPLRAVVVGVRLLAGAEAALGAAGIAYPDTVIAAGVGLSYACFALVVLYARARGGPLATCGCFGEPDTPPTALHALVDAVLAAAAAGYGASGPGATLTSLLAHQYHHGVPLLLAAALCGWLAFLAMVELPRLQAAQRAATGAAR